MSHHQPKFFDPFFRFEFGNKHVSPKLLHKTTINMKRSNHFGQIIATQMIINAFHQIQ